MEHVSCGFVKYVAIVFSAKFKQELNFSFSMSAGPPPPPPPHGAYQKASELPVGNYDIFVIPPHSAGSGFVYLPSLKPHTNSFLAGVACTLLAVGLWSLIVPVLKLWMTRVVASGGIAVVLVVVGVGVLGWAWGKTQSENTGAEAKADNSSRGTGPTSSTGYPPNTEHQTPPPRTERSYPGASAQPNPSTNATPNAMPKANWQQPKSTPATSEWEKAREETRKKEEERRKKEEAETKARQAAEKDKWDKARAREKETREREKEARERETREKVAKERREKELREKEEREAKERFDRGQAADRSGVGSKAYQKPTAQSSVGDDDAYSYRPYDTPKRNAGTTSQSSAPSESSYAPSHSTARTTPPPSQRGPYSTKDEEKIVIDAVYAFNDRFQKATAELKANHGIITDGLVLRLTTEGIFIDDDVRGEPQREWDVKAWTLKLLEVCHNVF